MYFWTYGLPKTWLDKRLKSPNSEDPLRSNMVKGPKHCSKLNTAPLPYSMIPVYAIQVGKVSLTDMQVFRLFANSLTPDNNYSILNRDNIYQHFQMQLSQKPKIFSQFFFLHFPDLDSIFNIFWKNMPLIADAFSNLRTRKDVVR